MVYILHVETSTKVCSVALSLNGKLVQIQETNDLSYSHGEKLTLFIEKVLSLQGIKPFDLNAVSDPIQMYLQDIFTVHANLTGNPAISLPLGKSADNMPFGIQLMAAPFKEKELFDFSARLETITLQTTDA